MGANRKKPAPKRVARPKAKSAKAKRPAAKLKTVSAKAQTLKAKAAKPKTGAVSSRVKPRAASKRAVPEKTRAPSQRVKAAAAPKAADRMPAGRVSSEQARGGGTEGVAGVASSSAISTHAPGATDADSGPPTVGAAVAAGETGDQESSPPGLPVPIASFTI